MSFRVARRGLETLFTGVRLRPGHINEDENVIPSLTHRVTKSKMVSRERETRPEASPVVADTCGGEQNITMSLRTDADKDARRGSGVVEGEEYQFKRCKGVRGSAPK